MTRSYNEAMTEPARSDPDVHHGVPCFAGTRVPVRALFDHLAAGDALEQFLAEFPSVDRADAVAVLNAAADRFTDPPRAAG